MIETLVYIFLAYLGIGLIFSIAFAIKGASALDDGLAQSPRTFRLLLIPGATLLWPVLLLKWMKA